MSNLLRAFFFIGDLVFLNLAIWLSVRIHSDTTASDNLNSIYLTLFSNLAWIFLVMVSTPYAVNKGWSITRIVKSQLVFLFIHLLVVASLIFFFNKSYSVLLIASIYLIFAPFFFTYRVGLFYLRKVFTGETQIKNYILIGKNELSSEIRKYFLMNPDSGYKFQGYFEFREKGFDLDKIHAFCNEKQVHEIYYCLPNPPQSELDALVQFGLNSLIKVRLILESTWVHQSIQLDRYEQQPGVNLVAIPLDEARNQILKRLFDLAFSGLFIVSILSWLIPIIGLIIKLDSRGPVFFVQDRSGEGNKPFRCLKFRTMKVNKDADAMQATKGDPRITKLGHFLRGSSIDELPQFINVFLGSMSVVGPRPHMLKHTEDYSKLIDQFMGRHYVKPGITGLAQCMGFRGETKDLSDMENRVRLDRYYIEKWTFWLDVKIIFLTVVSLIRGSDKAY